MYYDSAVKIPMSNPGLITPPVRTMETAIPI